MSEKNFVQIAKYINQWHVFDSDTFLITNISHRGKLVKEQSGPSDWIRRLHHFSTLYNSRVFYILDFTWPTLQTYCNGIQRLHMRQTAVVNAKKRIINLTQGPHIKVMWAVWSKQIWKRACMLPKFTLNHKTCTQFPLCCVSSDEVPTNYSRIQKHYLSGFVQYLWII